MANTFFNSLASAARTSLDVVLPPLCLSCQDMTASTHGFCAKCWAGLDFIAEPCCKACGLPFAFAEAALGPELLCGSCLTERPKFTTARAALSYSTASRDLILPFKHSDRTDAAPAFARLMLQAGTALMNESNLLMPVPLHGWRLFARRYNQAALLAKELGRLAQKPVLLEGLQRIRATPSQGSLTRIQREENVRGAFRVTPRYKDRIKGKNILLIDDVMTTGATVNACAKALLQAGAAQVRVLCLARVSREH